MPRIYTPYIEDAIKTLEPTSGDIKLSLIPIKLGDPDVNLNILLCGKDSIIQEIGKIKLNIKHKEASLSDIRIENNYQGKGLGKYALLSFYKLMDRLGIAKTTCQLQSENPYTAKFYLSIGMRFDHDALEKLARIYSNFDGEFEHFLQHSELSNTDPLEMFRVGNTPFEDSAPDQKIAFNTKKQTYILSKE